MRDVSASSTRSAIADDGSAIGFPWGWVVLALVLVALCLAVHSEMRQVTRRTRWHDQAMNVYGEGDALGDSVRTWAARPGDAPADTWAELVARHDRLVTAAERLAAGAPGPRLHERVARLADETRNLRSVVLLRAGNTPPTVSRGSDDLVRAAVSFDAALLEFRGTL